MSESTKYQVQRNVLFSFADILFTKMEKKRNESTYL